MVEEIKVDMPGAPKPIKKASSMVSAKAVVCGTSAVGESEIQPR
jgi:hypothetical protein